MNDSRVFQMNRLIMEFYSNFKMSWGEDKKLKIVVFDLIKRSESRIPTYANFSLPHAFGSEL